MGPSGREVLYVVSFMFMVGAGCESRGSMSDTCSLDIKLTTVRRGIDNDSTRQPGFFTIRGKVTNTGRDTYSYVLIKWDIFNKQGEAVETVMTNSAATLAPGAVWAFHTVASTSAEDVRDGYDFGPITAYCRLG